MMLDFEHRRPLEWSPVLPMPQAPVSDAPVNCAAGIPRLAVTPASPKSHPWPISHPIRSPGGQSKRRRWSNSKCCRRSVSPFAAPISRVVHRPRHPGRRFPDRRGARCHGGRERVRSARPVPGRRPSVPIGECSGADAEHDLALPPPDPRLLGRARRNARRHRQARAGARDRPSFRLVRRRYGGDRASGGRGRKERRHEESTAPAIAARSPSKPRPIRKKPRFATAPIARPAPARPFGFRSRSPAPHSR